MDCSCAPILWFFSVASDGATIERQIYNSVFFCQFRTSLRKDRVANYASIWTLFSLCVRGLDALCKALNIDTVVNTLFGGLTLDPAGTHCPSWDDAFVSSLFFLSRSESGAPYVRGVHSSNTHCVAIYRPISTRFAVFFRKGLFFKTRYIVLTFVARWRHNFREIAVKNCEKSKKSAEKFVRTTSYR